MNTKKEVLTVNKAELLLLFANIENNSRRCAISYDTDESGCRSINKRKALQKSVEMVVDFNHFYEAKVKKSANLDKFESSDNWHVNLLPTSRILKTDRKTKTKLYIAYTSNKDSDVKSTLFHLGKEIKKQDAINENFYTPSAIKNFGKSFAKDNVEIDFFFRVLEIHKIKQVNFNGKTYINTDFKSII